MHLNKKIILAVILFCACAVNAQTPEISPKSVSPPLPWLLFEVNSIATKLIKPAYPKAAADANISGRVEIKVSIDEKGNITEAKAVSGAPLLREVSEAAARQCQFGLTVREGKTVKVVGWLVYYLPDASIAAEFKKKMEMLQLGMQINSEVMPIAFLSGRGWMDTVDAMDPAILKEVKALDVFKNAPPGKMYSVFSGEVSNRVERKIAATQMWHFLLGKKLGKLIAEYMRQAQANPRTDANFKSALKEIKEQLKSAPADLPYWMSWHLTQVTELSEKKELTSDENLKLLEDRTLQILDDIRRQISVE
jgi:hypothetical protein